MGVCEKARVGWELILANVPLIMEQFTSKERSERKEDPYKNIAMETDGEFQLFWESFRGIILEISF